MIVISCLPAIAIANVNIELNKTEQRNNSCRVYLVIKNDTDLAFNTFKMDMVLFNKEDIISKNMALNIAPLQSAKKIVKAFDVKNIKCDGIGSILINKVMECEAEPNSNSDCIAMINTSSKNNISISK
ncbi:MAG: hypothetical protein AAF410_03825 [Pseudomonadota bacterium]